MSKLRVAVTGMSGLIGGILKQEWTDAYELVAVNRRPVDGVECHHVDVANLADVERALTGADVVVHLAALAEADAGIDDIVPQNIIGTYNVFEAARRVGARRVVFASSGAVVSLYELDSPYDMLKKGQGSPIPEKWDMVTHESPIRPYGLYGCSKAWGEALGRYYSDVFGLSVICLRIGAVRTGDEPESAREESIWCSHRDVAQMFTRCVEAPADLRFDTFFVVSNNTRNYRDIEHAREVLGYQPEDGIRDESAR